MIKDVYLYWTFLSTLSYGNVLSLDLRVEHLLEKMFLNNPSVQNVPTACNSKHGSCCQSDFDSLYPVQ